MAPGDHLPSSDQVDRQVATAVGHSVVQQAGRDIVNVAAPVADDRLGLISTEPPTGRTKQVHGRGDLLDVLERELANPSGHALVLHGGGGFGKTTLALEAARLAARDNTLVWWISASDAAQLNAGMSEVALALGARQGHLRARSLLRFLACFSQASIHYDLLDARAMRSIPAFDGLTPEELLELLHILADFGLVDSHHDKSLRSHALALHPLVRETNLHHLDATDDVEHYTWALLRVLEAALDGCDPLDHANKARWLATALHGRAPAALARRVPAARELLTRSTFLEYVTLLFVEYNQCWNYITVQRHVTG
ncbi:hypothetical protein [Umezawaea tangerina]|uniref:NB-ARC domain-containing protein n=1 Tax=Umezawaea tangerina TaxID=84725 RepID=A0A2T0THE0_9PSEU|nr:hypothetical protein [Umezawaea tangerina]PRY45028.1 hypothetical protein CLV43_102593 [Umezawaea tangerina]